MIPKDFLPVSGLPFYLLNSAFQRLHVLNFFFNFFYLVSFNFSVALGLRCCVQAFSSCSEWERLLIAGHRLLRAAASLVAKRGV